MQRTTREIAKVLCHLDAEKPGGGSRSGVPRGTALRAFPLPGFSCAQKQSTLWSMSDVDDVATGHPTERATIARRSRARSAYRMDALSESNFPLTRAEYRACTA